MWKFSGWSLIRLYTILIYIFMFAPIVVVIVLSFNPEQFGSFPMKGFSSARKSDYSASKQYGFHLVRDRQMGLCDVMCFF